MKNVMFYYNGIQAEEELHDDEVVEKLAEGQVMERAGDAACGFQFDAMPLAIVERKRVAFEAGPAGVRETGGGVEPAAE